MIYMNFHMELKTEWADNFMEWPEMANTVPLYEVTCRFTGINEAEIAYHVYF